MYICLFQIPMVQPGVKPAVLYKIILERRERMKGECAYRRERRGEEEMYWLIEFLNHG
jgi:hypothetical protein